MVKKVSENIKRGFLESFGTREKTVSTLILSTVFFLLMALSTDIPWHLETLERGVTYWDDAFFNSIASMRINGSYTVPLNMVYSLLSGAVITSVGSSLINGKFKGREITSILPGLAATGCASCGVGIAGFVGITGIAASLPFNGTFVKFLGILLLLYAVYSFGKPDKCVIDES